MPASEKPILMLPKTDYSRILALDMSLTGTGWATYDCEADETEYGVIESKILRGIERLDYVRRQVMSIVIRAGVASGKWLVLLEGYAFGARGAAVISLGELGGVMRLSFHHSGIEYLEVAPSQVKKFVCGRGTAHKDLILMEVFDRWGIKFENNNIADAFGLLQIGRALVGKPSKRLIAPQQEVVRAILKAYLHDRKDVAA